MVKFRFFHKHGKKIDNFGASDDLPDEVAAVHIHGPFDANKKNYNFLTTMLKSSPKKLEHIEIIDLVGESPEFLAFLVLIFNKTHSLNVSNCQLTTHACTCLMAALLTWDGIRHFSFTHEVDGSYILNDEAKILLEGVASSPCLESFDFHVFEPEFFVGSYLTSALRRNQSLKKIYVYTFPFSEHLDILTASILGPNMKEIFIEDSLNGHLRLDELQDSLCRKDCTVEKLSFHGLIFKPGPDSLDFWDGSNVQNVSVKSLTVKYALSEEGKLEDLIILFKSLEELNLFSNRFTQLSFLDPLLFSGKMRKLKSLDLSSNNIGENEMKRFLQKLGKLKGLKQLRIKDNDFGPHSATVKTALIDAFQHNTDLECIDFGYKELPLDLNRGGRRVFESPPKPFPTNLLPLVLERASRISYYKPGDKWGSPTNEEPRADVVFWMIQRMAPQL